MLQFRMGFLRASESHEEDVSAKVDEVVKELSEKLEEGHRREMQSEKARFEERLNKKEASVYIGSKITLKVTGGQATS